MRLSHRQVNSSVHGRSLAPISNSQRWRAHTKPRNTYACIVHSSDVVAQEAATKADFEKISCDLSSYPGVGMFKIEAVIRPWRQDKVVKALSSLGVENITASTVYGVGAQQGAQERYQGMEYGDGSMVVKSQLNIVCARSQVDVVVRAICESAFTGQVGDGKIFVLPQGDFVNIQTGQTSKAQQQGSKEEQSSKGKEGAKLNSQPTQQPASHESSGQAPAASPSSEASGLQKPPNDSTVRLLDIRVGLITEIEKHPDADSLYVEKIDTGDDEPRTICSGLVNFIPQDQLLNRKVIVLCNLAPRKMRGVPSAGMLLCASATEGDKEVVEVLDPPAGAKVGERIYFGSDGQDQPEPEAPKKVGKKKMWERCMDDFKMVDSVASFQGLAMLTSCGPVTAKGISNGKVG